MEKTPADIRKILAAAPKAGSLWKDLTPIARRDFISWVESAKQPETRRRRAQSIPSRLLSGKRRPCCFAIVPMNLYRELALSPKAKAQWKVLAPDARRDFIDWIDKGKDPEARAERIRKTCTLLEKGKGRP